MENINFSIPALEPTNYAVFAINLCFCIVAAFLLRYVYERRSISLSGKFHIGTVIPILACVTFLVIMVVKSSLALSLGLVGALSVIRFRTPIKEPEELVYLFLSIALGLGYGAGQTFVTSIVFIVILCLIILWLSRKTSYQSTEYNIHIDWTGSNVSLNEILDLIRDSVTDAELQKYATGSSEQSVFLKVNMDSISKIDGIVKSIRGLDESVNCAFYEARPLQ